MTRDNKILGSFSVILLLCSVASIIAFFLFPFVSQDSGYFLSMMRDIHDGNIYFLDISSPYNPLAIWILGIPYYFIETPIFVYHLLINHIIMILSTILLFRILKNFNLNKILTLFLSLTFFVMCLIYDGNFIMLEPISVLFQLVALQQYLIYRQTGNIQKLILCGLFVSLSFLSKQFGLFLLIPIGLDIVLRNNRLFKSLLFLGIGLAFPIILLIGYYAFYGMDLLQFVMSVLGKGQTFDVGTGTGMHTGFKVSNLFDCLLYMPFVYLIPFFLTGKNFKDLIFYSTLALSSMTVFIFASYDHYFQYIFPYVIILFGFVMSTNQRFLTKPLFYILILVGVLRLSFKTVSTIKHQKEDYKIQQENLSRLNQAVPNGSQVYLNGISCAYYYLCNYKSINLEKIGYAFPGYFYLETILENTKNGSYLIVTEENLEGYRTKLSEFEKKSINFQHDHGQEIIYIFKKK